MTYGFESKQEGVKPNDLTLLPADRQLKQLSEPELLQIPGERLPERSNHHDLYRERRIRHHYRAIHRE